MKLQPCRRLLWSLPPLSQDAQEQYWQLVGCCLLQEEDLAVALPESVSWEDSGFPSRLPLLLQKRVFRGELEALQIRLEIDRCKTIGIGHEASTLKKMVATCGLFFFTGAESELKLKYATVVPLWGQGDTGVLNVLRFFASNGTHQRFLTNADVIDFVGRSLRFYEREDAADAVLQRHHQFCAELFRQFPGLITGIFGTGFPFYCLDPESGKPCMKTPPSILRYLRTQQRYFERKLVHKEKLIGTSEVCFSRASAEETFDLQLTRNVFDRYEYEKIGISPPMSSPEDATMRVFHEHACFDYTEAPWPCAWCAPIQSPVVFPKQAVLKDTNETCFRCRQTPLVLRNVMGSCIDLDVIVAVRGDYREAATAIQSYVVEHSSFYLCDLAPIRTLLHDNDGPVDLFVTSDAHLIDALERIHGDDWLSVEFPAVALWSLTLKDYRFHLGEDIAFGFEPQTELDSALRIALNESRRRFAGRRSIAEVLDGLRNQSFAKRQLLEDEDVTACIQRRLQVWGAECPQ